MDSPPENPPIMPVSHKKRKRGWYRDRRENVVWWSGSAIVKNATKTPRSKRVRVEPRCTHGVVERKCNNCHPGRAKKIKEDYHRNKYGLEPEHYIEWFEKQSYRCGCCKTPIKPYVNTTNVDHIHVEGYKNLSAEEKRKLVRGFLCSNCNIGIGKLGDTLEGVMNAVNYLS